MLTTTSIPEAIIHEPYPLLHREGLPREYHFEPSRKRPPIRSASFLQPSKHVLNTEKKKGRVVTRDDRQGEEKGQNSRSANDPYPTSRGWSLEYTIGPSYSRACEWLVPSFNDLLNTLLTRSQVFPGFPALLTWKRWSSLERLKSVRCRPR